MNNQKISIKEALNITVGILKDIRLPMDLFDEVGVPIKRAIINLNTCVDVIDQEEKNAHPVQVEEEPEIVIEPVDDSEEAP